MPSTAPSQPKAGPRKRRRKAFPLIAPLEQTYCRMSA
jgi:hypothetical protein